jgi:hypothetical protein
VRKRDYGGATHEEIMAGMELAIKIAKMIRTMPNPAVRNMIKDLIALIDPICGE